MNKHLKLGLIAGFLMLTYPAFAITINPQQDVKCDITKCTLSIDISQYLNAQRLSMVKSMNLTNFITRNTGIDLKYSWNGNVITLFADIRPNSTNYWEITTPDLTIDPWFNSSWIYKQALNNTNLVNATINMPYLANSTGIDTASLISAGKLQADCDDLRFVNATENATYNYVFENATGTYGCNKVNTIVWAMHNNSALASSTDYMYYGNPSAVAGTNGLNFCKEASLQTFWTFGEEQGTKAYDICGLDNLTYGTGIVYSTGKFGYGLNITSTGGASNRLPYINLSSYTVSMWAYPTDNTTTNAAMIIKGNRTAPDFGTNREWQIGYINYGNCNNHWCFYMFGNCGEGDQMAPFTSVPTKAWTYMAAVYNATNNSISTYTNGVFTSSVKCTRTVFTNGTLALNAQNAGEKYNGALDNVMIFNRSLSANEILALYNGTASSFVGNETQFTSSTMTQLFLNGNRSNMSVAYGSSINATATLNISNWVAILINGTLSANGTSTSSNITTMPPGTWNYTAYHSADASTNASSETWFATVGTQPTPVISDSTTVCFKIVPYCIRSNDKGIISKGALIA